MQVCAIVCERTRLYTFPHARPWRCLEQAATGDDRSQSNPAVEVLRISFSVTSSRRVATATRIQTDGALGGRSPGAGTSVICRGESRRSAFRTAAAKRPGPEGSATGQHGIRGRSSGSASTGSRQPRPSFTRRPAGRPRPGAVPRARSAGNPGTLLLASLHQHGDLGYRNDCRGPNRINDVKCVGETRPRDLLRAPDCSRHHSWLQPRPPFERKGPFRSGRETDTTLQRPYACCHQRIHDSSQCRMHTPPRAGLHQGPHSARD